ncbi:kinase-like protein [Trametes coccinea BRFM310]|uniref:Kinase-like protein n=1 Tax=Trametes coccinea (strain BRFM310) TaxID=1353009 RepID=A0A1Y2I9Z4_TRAC3|nr:kinase-like protein [Trametes coccinea BRFM310]
MQSIVATALNGDNLCHGRISELPGGLLLKVSPIRGASEGDIIRFVQRHTYIPTPPIVASVQGHGRRFLLMKKVKGSTLEKAWMTLSTAERTNVVAQLRSYIAQLRSLRSPHGSAVCGLSGEAVVDCRITSSAPVGPFPNEAAFNDRLADTSTPFKPAAEVAEIRARMRDDHAIVFTHGDIAPRNVIVDGDRVVAVLDWEQAGWFPEHWEWIKAMWCPPDPKPASELWGRAVKGLFARDYRAEWRIDCDLSDGVVGGF